MSKISRLPAANPRGFNWDSAPPSTPGSPQPASPVNARLPSSPPSLSAAASRCSASSRKPLQEPVNFAAIAAMLQDTLADELPLRSQSVASQTRFALRNTVLMAFSFAALLPPVASLVPYSPSALLGEAP